MQEHTQSSKLIKIIFLTPSHNCVAFFVYSGSLLYLIILIIPCYIFYISSRLNITLKTATNANFISALQLEQALKDKIRDRYSTFQDAFNQIDLNKTGNIGLSELQKVLIDLNFLVDDDTFAALIDK